MTTPASEAAILAWLAAQQEAMLRLLEEVVNIDSGSYDRPASTPSASASRVSFANTG